MRLHENIQLFADAIEAAARPEQEGGLGIKSIFIEKDYWICRSLSLMADGDLRQSVCLKPEPSKPANFWSRSTASPILILSSGVL